MYMAVVYLRQELRLSQRLLELNDVLSLSPTVMLLSLPLLV